jgi:hypothetical protein
MKEKTILALALFASLVVPAIGKAKDKPDALELLASAVQTQHWSEGAKTCDELPSRESRLRHRETLPASRYAILAARCAVIKAAGGDATASDWWWYTALAMDARAAAEEAKSFPSVASFHPASPLHHVGETKSSDNLAKDQFRLVDGTVVTGTPPRRLGPARPPQYMFEPLPGIARTEIQIECILGTDGLLHQPLLVSARTVPAGAFLAFAWLRDWRYQPALVDGKPVATLFTASVTFHLES